MALEGKIELLVGLVHVLHGDAPLDGADAEARAVWEVGHAAALILEGRLNLPVRLLGVAQVEDLDLAIRRPNGEERMLGSARRGPWG